MSQLLVWNQFGAAATDRIRAAGLDVGLVDVVEVPVRPQCAPDGPVADALFAMPYFGVGPEERAAADVSWSAGVPWVHLGASGIDLFPRALLEGREIVTSARGASSSAIAEFVLTVMLADEKSVPDIWSQPASALHLGTLRGRTVGIIGFGTIGERIAALARAFGAEVVATRRSGASATAADGTRLATLEQVVAVADHLVLALPATPQTHHLLDDALFDRFKIGMHVINIARGSIIDHDAMVRALESGRVGSASLDVTDPEPLPHDHPLRHDGRVRISPHVAWMEPQSMAALIETFVVNLAFRCTGQPLVSPIDLALGY